MFWLFRWNTEWWVSWAGVVVELRGGLFLDRTCSKAPAYIRLQDPTRLKIRTRPEKPEKQQSGFHHWRLCAGQSQEQTLTRRSMQLGLTWASQGSLLRQPVHRRNHYLQPLPVSAVLADAHGSTLEKASRRRVPAEERFLDGRRRRWASVSPLRYRQDAAVADGSNGSEDSVQRLRREVQIGTSCAGVPAGGESDVRVDKTFQFSSESYGAPATEGDDQVPPWPSR